MTTLENIWNITGNVPLANPQYTNTLGQLVNQVFLADKDYTVRFEKYIGNGRMEDDDDQQNWLFVYSCDNLYNTFSIDVTSTNIQAVNNITELRSTDPFTVEARDNKQLIELLGYNTAGDKPAVRYVWNPNSVESDNGGSVIKVSGIATGRWELINDFNYIDGVDVRHFGVFGKDTLADVEPTMAAKLDMANTYAMGIGFPLYFTANDGELTWYKINSNLNGALFANGSRIVATNDCTVIVTSDNAFLDVYNDVNNTKVVTITGSVVRTSWGVNSNKCIFAPTLKLIIDSPITTHNKTFSNLEVDCLYDVNECTFTNCQLNSNGKLCLDNTFHQCVLKEYMFAPTFTATVYDDDVIEIDDWPSTNKWLYLVTQNAAKPLDFKGRVVDGSCHVGWSNCTYKNAVFSGYTAPNQTVLMFGCSGNVNFSNNVTDFAARDTENLIISMANPNLNLGNFTDCSLTFGQNMTFNSLYAIRTAFNDEGHTYTLNYSGFKDCTLNVEMTASDFNASSCTLNKVIHCNVVTLMKCDIYNIIDQISTAQQMNFLIYDCTFNGAGEHILSSNVPHTVVVGTWMNNAAFTKHPITINWSNANIATNDMAHNYKYENNRGKFLERNPKVSYMMGNFHRYPQGVMEIGGYDHKTPRLVDSGLIEAVTRIPIENGIYIPSEFSHEISMFSIGTRSAFLKMTVSWFVGESTMVSDSFDPPPKSWYKIEGMMPFSTNNPLAYPCDCFNSTFLNPVMNYPKNAQFPKMYNETGSTVYITLEVVEW